MVPFSFVYQAVLFGTLGLITCIVKLMFLF